MFTCSVKNSTSWNDPGVGRTACIFWLSPAHWKIRCDPSNSETQCCGEEYPQNIWIWPASNLFSISMFYLWVATVQVSNSRSLCSKTRKCSHEVTELPSNSLPSVKGMWKYQTDLSRRVSRCLLIKVNKKGRVHTEFIERMKDPPRHKMF